MLRVVFILLILALLFYLSVLFRRLNFAQRNKLIKRLAIFCVLGIVVLLVLSGRVNFIFAAIAALLPVIPRLFRFIMGAWPALMPYFKRYRQNHLSSMQSRFIQLQINIITGELQGEVLAGEYKGQLLQKMTKEALLSLLEQCKQQDAESAALLIAFLDARHADWSNAKTGNNNDSFRQPETKMSKKQACEILGVPENSNKKQVIAAHKKLMQKIHPDKGGSVYLAQLINQAKDTLI